MEARGRADAVEAESEHLKESLAKVMADLALKEREAKARKAKELAKAERKVGEKAVVCKASTDFIAKAQPVAAFRTSKGFYDDHRQFNKEAFHEGFKLVQDDYHLQVVT